MKDRLLVVAQFGLIALMLFFSRGLSMFVHPTLLLLIFLFGFAIGLWALAHNKLGNFHIRPKMKEGSELITTGIYRYVRHPMYASVFLMMLAVLLSDPSLLESLLFASLLLVLAFKANREEAIWSRHDEAYEVYRKNTKLFIPYIL